MNLILNGTSMYGTNGSMNMGIEVNKTPYLLQLHSLGLVSDMTILEQLITEVEEDMNLSPQSLLTDVTAKSMANLLDKLNVISRRFEGYVLTIENKLNPDESFIATQDQAKYNLIHFIDQLFPIVNGMYVTTIIDDDEMKVHFHPPTNAEELKHSLDGGDLSQHLIAYRLNSSPEGDTFIVPKNNTIARMMQNGHI